MQSFRYTALTATGERVSGLLSGMSEQAVLSELETRRLTPVSVSAEDGGGGLSLRGVFGGARRGGPGGGRPSGARLATAYTQLADLLRAGVPLLRGLRLLGSQKGSARIGRVFSEVADAVAEGDEVALAMSRRPDVFPKIHVAMVRAGEKGGFLEGVFARLGEFLSKQAAMRSAIIGSLVYPTILVVAGTVVLGLIFGVFIPMFRKEFEHLDLNVLTRTVLGLSVLVREHGVWFVPMLVVAGVVLWRVSKRPAMKRRLSVLSVRLPVVGPLVRSLAVARFCRVLGTLLTNAIPMMAALEISREAAGNVLLEEAIDKATEAVRSGERLAPPLSESGLISEDVVEMISVGEAANNLDKVLLTIAETLEQRTERMLSVAVKLIEPLLLALLALVIALVALAIVLPLTQMSRSV